MKVEIEYRVPYADTDQMGVVYYANYFTYFERVRNELLREGGYLYIDMEKDGYFLPVFEASCRYKRPAKYDDLLTLTAEIVEIKGPKIKIVCEVFRAGTRLVTGFTWHACMNKEGKPVRPPKKLLGFIE